MKKIIAISGSTRRQSATPSGYRRDGTGGVHRTQPKN